MFNLDGIKHVLGSLIGQASEPLFDPVQMLEDDHGKVKRNFELFQDAEGEEKRKIVAETLLELTVHTQLEDELVYPILRTANGALIDEAEQEHHVAELLIKELQEMLLSQPQFDAKFKVLGEAVKHHIKEEESKALPLLRQQDIDLNELGARMDARKQELVRQYKNRALEQRSAKEKSPRAGQKVDSNGERKSAPGATIAGKRQDAQSSAKFSTAKAKNSGTKKTTEGASTARANRAARTKQPADARPTTMPKATKAKATSSKQEPTKRSSRSASAKAAPRRKSAPVTKKVARTVTRPKLKSKSR